MIKVYLANRPPMAEYLNTDVMDSLPMGEIRRIANETGNHWRKIFNVYAKLIYCLAGLQRSSLLRQYGSWQAYRDRLLLQQGSDTELYFDHFGLFSQLNVAFDREAQGIDSASGERVVHIVMGKSFSERLLEGGSLEWLDDDFAINYKKSLIVCPYFDYRQLSNVKIERLAALIMALQSTRTRSVFKEGE